MAKFIKLTCRDDSDPQDVMPFYANVDHIIEFEPAPEEKRTAVFMAQKAEHTLVVETPAEILGLIEAAKES